MDVYFDDVTVTFTPSAVVQQDDYYPFGLTFNSYSRENSTPNKYQYNGKERQDDLNLGWIDFGPRMAMPDIGRFNRMDIFSEMSESISSYSYAENDPINANDLGGNFKFPANFRHDYPRVTAYLEKIMPLLQNNQAIVNSLNKHTHLAKETIKSDFQNGNGPTVNPGDFEVPHWGNNSVIGRVEVNAGGLLQQLENGLATNDPKYEEFTDVYKLMTIVTIIHEYVHEASRRTKFRLPTGWGDHDEGSNWEHEMFGRFIDFPTKSMAQEFKQDNPNTHNTAQSLREEVPFIFYQVTTGSTSGKSQKKKPDADKEAAKKHGGW
jgi:RHS repeat-associated protein